MKFIELLEVEAMAQLDVIRSLRTHEGPNDELLRRAKISIGVIGGYVRLRATIANERAITLAERRFGLAEPKPPLAITEKAEA
jgi:hypothetical protein